MKNKSLVSKIAISTFALSIATPILIGMNSCSGTTTFRTEEQLLKFFKKNMNIHLGEKQQFKYWNFTDGQTEITVRNQETYDNFLSYFSNENNLNCRDLGLGYLINYWDTNGSAAFDNPANFIKISKFKKNVCNIKIHSVDETLGVRDSTIGFYRNNENFEQLVWNQSMTEPVKIEYNFSHLDGFQFDPPLNNITFFNFINSDTIFSPVFLTVPNFLYPNIALTQVSA